MGVFVEIVVFHNVAKINNSQGSVNSLSGPVLPVQTFKTSITYQIPPVPAQGAPFVMLP